LPSGSGCRCYRLKYPAGRNKKPGSS